jgi:hypothetical protein
VQSTIDHDERTGHRAPVLLRVEAKLLAGDRVDAEERLDIVHDGIRLRLFVELRLLPVLRDIVGFSLGCEVVIADELLGERHHPERLCEVLDGVYAERALLALPADLQVAALLVVRHVREGAHRKLEIRPRALADRPVNALRRLRDGSDRLGIAGIAAPGRLTGRLVDDLLGCLACCLAARHLALCHQSFRLRSSTSVSVLMVRSRSASDRPRIS